MHVSLCDPETNQNLFARSEPDPNAPYEDIKHLSDLGRHFLAGLIEGLPYVMPIFAPTINSYKRLVENFWAPVTVSWGLEHRAASIRLIAPPTASPKSTRFEVRVPGADTNPYLVLATILALGWRGVEKKLEIPIPPLGKGEDVGGASDKGVRLAKSLREATDTFKSKDSIAREVFGDDFVDHFAGTREHELRLWDEAVTDWYVDLSLSLVGCLLTALCSQGVQALYRDCLRTELVLQWSSTPTSLERLMLTGFGSMRHDSTPQLLFGMFHVLHVLVDLKEDTPNATVLIHPQQQLQKEADSQSNTSPYANTGRSSIAKGRERSAMP